MRNSLSILSFVTVALLLSACAKGGGNSPANPAIPPAQQGPKPVEFPRTFSATFRIQDNRTAQFISSSSYSSGSDKSLFGCAEAAEGKEFTFVMKNEDQYPDDFKIRVKNGYIRESKQEYRNLTDVALDGFTRNKYFEFNSKEQSYQLQRCEGKMERVKNYLSGFFQCFYVQPKNGSKAIDFVLQFSCDIIQR